MIFENYTPDYTGDIFRIKNESRQKYHFDMFLTYNANRMYFGFMKFKREKAGGYVQSFIEHVLFFTALNGSATFTTIRNSMIMILTGRPHEIISSIEIL